MSNENEAKESSSIPQDVIDLQKAVADLGSYRTALQHASFPGSQLEAGFHLKKFINEAYQQTLNQFNEHPYVVEARAKAQAEGK